MITKVAKRGDRMRGLVGYVFGPGRFDEHTGQRVVGAWDEAWVGVRQPNSDGQSLLAAELDAPRRLLRPDLDRHVYHVVVSNPAGDRQLTDDEWRRVTNRIADELGLTETASRAPARWIAVHHGVSSGGNDHIHFVASLVREDGSTAPLSNDFRKLGEVRRHFEAEFGLTSTARGAGMPGLSRAEVAIQAASGAELPRQRLQRAVRAAAAAADSETEFVGNLRDRGVLVRPRWEQGGRDAVSGYMVALPTTERDTALRWFGGRRLASDLSLIELRKGWSSDPATAIERWREVDPASKGGRRPGAPTRAPAAEAVEAARGVDAARTALASSGELSIAARHAAGLLAAAAEQATGTLRRDLVRTSDALTRLAQPARRATSSVPRPVALTTVARLMLTSTVMRQSHETVAAVTLLRALAELAVAVAAAHRSRAAAATALAATAEATTSARALMAAARPAATTVSTVHQNARNSLER